jgi:hypothetical protein
MSSVKINKLDAFSTDGYSDKSPTTEWLTGADEMPIKFENSNSGLLSVHFAEFAARNFIDLLMSFRT